ncbi:hypothetical protein [uncultured Muribaculum sp.]|uniref:hypothetical protein n=1 Tax=uncultured Muribaculum sp. TaxID=1918613 RepID=UPI0025B11C17|nr:hypothetical protein [uncultured Muribaculum sp.]
MNKYSRLIRNIIVFCDLVIVLLNDYKFNEFPALAKIILPSAPHAQLASAFNTRRTKHNIQQQHPLKMLHFS